MIANCMMRGLAVVALIVLCTIACDVDGVTVSCMMAYEEGGAPAVFSSLECPHWIFKAESSESSKRKCQFATVQGHREYQEDRVVCNLELKLPFSVEAGPEEITVGVAGVFDGHGGAEASEMASTKLLKYLSVHAVVTAYKQMLLSDKGHHDSYTIKSSDITVHTINHNSLRQILEEALLRTIHDIDSDFSKEALDNGYISGSTGTVALLVGGQFLVANVGDSKALLCSEKVHSRVEGGPSVEVDTEELTRDHHPDRKDEKARIEATGGYVSTWGVARVNGILAVSRAIGDVYLKRYGVIPEPEITGWRTFSPENSFLVVASDGIFERQSPQNVCQLIHDKASQSSSENISLSSSLADWIVQEALNTGSMDNLSAIVISDLSKYADDSCAKDSKLAL